MRVMGWRRTEPQATSHKPQATSHSIAIEISFIYTFLTALLFA